MEKKENFKSLQAKVKELIKISKEKNLIKSHTEAFEEFPVEEEHNGKKESFCRKVET